MIIRIKNKYNIKKTIDGLIFVIVFIFLLPNDYKHIVKGLPSFLNVFILLFDITYILLNIKSFSQFVLQKTYFIFPFIISFIATLLNRNDILDSIFDLVNIITIMIIELKYFNLNNKYLVLLEKIVFILLFIVCFYIFYYREPMSYSASGGRIYFIFEGEISKLVLGSFLLFTTIKMKNKFYKFLHYPIYILLYIFILQSGVSSAIGLTIYIVSFFICKFKELRKLVNYKSIFTCFFIVLFLIISQFGRNIISETFNKSNTFSGRTEIWISMWELIKEHPIIGIGKLSSEKMLMITQINGATHAHNQFIQIIVNSGLIGLMMYCITFLKISKIKTQINKNKLFLSYTLYLFSILIMSITRNCFDNLFYFYTLLVLINLERMNSRTHS